MIVKEVNRLQAANLRTTSKIKEAESEGKTIQMQMQAEQKKVSILTGLLAKEQKLLADKKKTLYQVEYNLQKCEMKFERLRGQERDKSEVERKQKRIEELQALLTEKTATSKLLQNQTTNLEVSLFPIDPKKIQEKLVEKN